jgi:hypothetical protein
VVAARSNATLIIVARHDRLVDVDRLKGLIAKLPDLHVFTDSDQGHGWNEAAVHHQLEVLKDFFGNCADVAPVHRVDNPVHAANGSNGNGAHHANGVTTAIAPILRDTLEVRLSPS